MLDRRRSVSAILLAASVFALPVSAIASQDKGGDKGEDATKESSEESKPKYRVRASFQRDIQALRAAGQAIPRFYVAGPSQVARASSRSTAIPKAAGSRRYTEAELVEIRAAQIEIVRQLTAGPSQAPRGGVTVSHPRLGRIVVDLPSGSLAPAEGGPSGGLVRSPIPGLISGPSSISTTFGDVPEAGGSSGDPVEAPVLEPGPGFRGPTSQPPAAGDASMLGYDAKAIARWDVVPYQTFDGVFEIGVVAFHMRGIDRVEFSVDGGDWEPVRNMTVNPRTQVEEYWVKLDASLFDDDGPVEVRAIIYPTVGIPRVLDGEMDWENDYLGPQWTGEHSMFLHANASGTSGEVIVELPEGIYEWGDFPGVSGDLPDNRWLVIQPEAGASVTLVPGLWRDQPQFVRIKDVDLIQIGTDAHVRGSTRSIMWFDGVDYTGPGMWVDSNKLKAKHSFWTDSSVTEVRWGQAEHFVRNSNFSRVGEDTFHKAYMLLNTVVDNQGEPPAHLGWHAGVVANPIEHDNRIYFGLDITTRQKAWAFRNGTNDYWEHTDVAIVRCRTNKTTDGNQLLYLGGQTNHMLIKDNVWRGDESWNYRLNDRVSIPEWKFTPHNVLMENNDWYGDPSWFPNPTPLEGVTIIPIGSDRPLGG